MPASDDSLVRLNAIDPECSFIVQAPAGSGKTQLIAQRVLRLLGSAVNAPEEVIAITFTRKAALEMKERIFFALKEADAEPAPTEPHKLTTWRLAKEVLEVDQEKGWHILDNPSRLNINIYYKKRYFITVTKEKGCENSFLKCIDSYQSWCWLSF